MGYGGGYGGSSYTGVLSGSAVQQYDTGLNRPQRTTIRNAIVDLLSVYLKSNGGYLGAVLHLPQPMQGSSDEELGRVADTARGVSPCILVALGSKSGYEKTGQDGPPTHWRAEIEVSVYVCSTNLRSLLDGRLATDVVGAADATFDPGIEAMLEHVSELMIGQSLGIASVLEVQPRSEDLVLSTSDVTIWEQRYVVQVAMELNPDRNETTIITEIEARHQIEGNDHSDPFHTTLTEVPVP